MRAGWAGGVWRKPGKAARRLQSGSRAKRGQAGSSYGAPNESPWTGLRREESVGGNERTKQAVSVPIRGQSLPFLHDKQT